MTSVNPRATAERDSLAAAGAFASAASGRISRPVWRPKFLPPQPAAPTGKPDLSTGNPQAISMPYPHENCMLQCFFLARLRLPCNGSTTARRSQDRPSGARGPPGPERGDNGTSEPGRIARVFGTSSGSSAFFGAFAVRSVSQGSLARRDGSQEQEWQLRIFGAEATGPQSPSGRSGSGRRQGASLAGAMQGPRLSTWRLFLARPRVSPCQQ